MKNLPVKKPAKGDAAGGEAFERIEAAWHAAGAAVDAYAGRVPGVLPAVSWVHEGLSHRLKR